MDSQNIDNLLTEIKSLKMQICGITALTEQFMDKYKRSKGKLEIANKFIKLCQESNNLKEEYMEAKMKEE